MFTGIVEDIGRVIELRRGGRAAGLSVRSRLGREEPAPGVSIAVDGACLTLSETSGEELTFDLSGETLSRTTLGRLSPGDEVHLERALALGSRLDGHLVTGHVDGVGRLLRRVELEEAGLELHFEAPPQVAVYLVDKGSIAVCGVSLTLVEPQSNRFRVALVPQTLQRTYLGRLPPGREVNLEADIIGKYVRRFAGGKGTGIDEEFLKQHGFG